MKIHKKKEFGKFGENIAAKYLEENGYKIITRNFYCNVGEIDIIAKYKNEIIFVEVKTRSGEKYGLPSEAVNSAKIRHLYNTSKYFLKKQNKWNYIRFDVIEVLLKNGKFNVNHIKQIL